ncbi:MAG: VIT1/CCC1 transporter family protein [Thermoplasmata archaeon]
MEPHSHPTTLSDFILGSQDGIVNVLGILLGLLAAGTSSKLILIAALAALTAESISMGAVAYTSTLSRRSLYLSEVERERREMAEVPEEERREVQEILQGWGFEGEEQAEMLRRIESKPQAMLDVMMAFELRLAPVHAGQARQSALLVGGATVVGSFIPLLPVFFTTNPLAIGIGSVVLSAAMLFAVGWYEARITLGSLWTSGTRMVIIGLVAGFAGFLIGHVLGALP